MTDEVSPGNSISTIRRSLSCAFPVPPGSLVVRDSHVSFKRQSHDLRDVASGSGSRIRFGLTPFRLTMFHRSGYRPRTFISQSHPTAHLQGPLLQWGTLTPSDRLKLSSEPCISARSQVLQVSPRTPGSFLSPQQPTGADEVAPFISERPLMWIFTTSFETGLMRVTTQPVFVSPNILVTDWVEVNLSVHSARFSRTSQRYPACS